MIATASELFEGRHYPGVVAMCTDALENEPECVPLLLIRARARIALRRDLDAQADLRDVIRLDPRCSVAYRLLGELAARSDETESAAVLLQEALRLNPDDREANDWLLIVAALVRPAAGVAILPAPAPAAGRFSSSPPAVQPAVPSRLARGTRDLDSLDERPTKPRGWTLDRNDAAQPSAHQPSAHQPSVHQPSVHQPSVHQPSLPPPAGSPSAAPAVASEVPTLAGRPAPPPPAREAPRLTSRSSTVAPPPDLPGFGDYLVANGILTRERLRAAQAYQRSMRVQLSTAIITLGLATPQRIEWAAVAHEAQVAHDPRSRHT